MDRKNAEAVPLFDSYYGYVERVNAALERELELYSESEFVGPLRYALDGGKRIRPVILVLSAESAGCADENAYAASCAVEFLHTESIIHDDIIDEETQRRRRDPFHVKYGYNTSVLTGDFVLGLILSISSRLNNARITKDLATTAMLMSEGEMMEARLERGGDATFDDYIRAAEYKTATAFEAAARIGAVLGGGGEEAVGALTEYGRNVGIAYQIRDDLHDWQNEDKLFNQLIKKSPDPRRVFDRMEEMLSDYSGRAGSALRRVRDCGAKSSLESLARFASLRG